MFLIAKTAMYALKVLINLLQLIKGFDHHCPWVSKCVGRGNINGFYVFVFSTMLLFGYLILGLSIAK